MSKPLVVRKISIVNFLIVAWAVALSLVTLSQGADSFSFSTFLYPVIFFPFAIVPLFRFKIIKTTRKMVSAVLLFFFIISGLISASHHGDMAMVYSVFAFSLYLLTGLYLYPALFDKRQQFLFFNAVFCFSLFYFIFFSFKYDLIIRTSLHYENPNTLGIAAASIAILGLGLFFSMAENKAGLCRKLLYIAGVLFMLYLTLLSVSRTAFLSIVMVFFLLGAVYFLRADMVRKVKFTFFMIIIGFFLFYFFADLAFDTVIGKFQRKEDDVFDSRSILWEFILENTGILGLGMEFFRSDAFIAAHSTYFSFLGRYGWSLFVPFFLLLLFLAWDIFYRLVFKREDSSGYVCFSLYFGFLVMSIAEIMIFKSIMVYAFVFIGGYAAIRADSRLKSFRPNEG